MADHRLRVALAGNPNCGKTTIFNRLTGGHQRVGNYSGVTVERVTGICKLSDGHQVEIVDLPGIYSLSNGSPEERVAFSELISGKIDLVVDVVDSGNAQRNLYLTTQLAELGIPMVIDFNMIDDAEEAGLQFDFLKFSSFFGARIVKTVGSTGFGIQELRGELHRAATGDAPGLPIAPKFGPLTEDAIAQLEVKISEKMPASLGAVPLRCVAVKLLENDPHLCGLQEFSELAPTVRRWQDAISARNGIGIDALIADFRYGVVAGACREAITIRNDNRRR
ncbi:MAG: 50S ribosome-binding GTPase, partial [Victivallaceae bacterium]|nr:50S ribosome-binding GTPase [Victivallaceae bacterium]